MNSITAPLISKAESYDLDREQLVHLRAFMNTYINASERDKDVGISPATIRLELERIGELVKEVHGYEPKEVNMQIIKVFESFSDNLIVVSGLGRPCPKIMLVDESLVSTEIPDYNDLEEKVLDIVIPDISDVNQFTVKNHTILLALLGYIYNDLLKTDNRKRRTGDLAMILFNSKRFKHLFKKNDETSIKRTVGIWLSKLTHARFISVHNKTITGVTALGKNVLETQKIPEGTSFLKKKTNVNREETIEDIIERLNKERDEHLESATEIGKEIVALVARRRAQKAAEVEKATKDLDDYDDEIKRLTRDLQ